MKKLRYGIEYNTHGPLAVVKFRGNKLLAIHIIPSYLIPLVRATYELKKHETTSKIKECVYRYVYKISEEFSENKLV